MAAGRLQQLQLILKPCTPSLSLIHTLPKIIHVTPEVSQFDQKINIRLEGLPSHSKVTVHAVTEQVWKRNAVQFGACGHYITSHIGQVNLDKETSVGGTYTGVEPMGLFWSMRPNPSGPQNIRMVLKNVVAPVVYQISVYQGHLILEDLFQDPPQHQPLSTVKVKRVILPADVRRIPVEEGKVRGMLFLPPGEGPFRGVVDMFGMAGGLIETRAALLASHGFAALSLPYFNYKDLPTRFEEQSFEYFENAAQWFDSHPSVAAGGIGVMGVSGGANLALMMAYKCPQVKAYVRINGQSFHSIMDMEEADRRFTVGLSLNMKKCINSEDGLVTKDAVEMDDKQLIPLWKKDVHTLALVSEDDGQIQPWITDRFYQMYPEERRHLMEVVHYPGAGHLLEPPYTPLCRACYNPYFDTDLVWGGYPREHAAAQENSWKKILHFFRKHLPSAAS